MYMAVIKELKFRNFFIKENGEILKESELTAEQRKEVTVNFNLNQKKGYERAGYIVTEIRAVN